MILDAFKGHSLTVQIRYKPVYKLWDRAGNIASLQEAIWPGLTPVDTQANQQTLRTKEIQIQTGLDTSTITLFGPKLYESAKIQKIKDTFDVWRKELELSTVTRVSSRVIFVKEFSTLRDANAALLGLNLIRWPTTKVFDQPVEAEANGPDIFFRFEDESSFAFLRLKAEKVVMEAELPHDLAEIDDIKITKSRMVIDFDRGLLGNVKIETLRMDEWLRGHQHLLRRDIEKITGDKV